MLVVGIVVAVIAAVALLAGSIYWLVRLTSRKEAADLRRYLQSDSCQWERVDGPAAGPNADEGAYFINRAPEPQGIQMRVYHYTEPADGSRGDDEGVCLSIIDPANQNGMILNGFALHLEAMQFGDTLWNERFLGDTGIMEQVIREKRVDWDQMQQQIIVGHYALFM